MKFNVTEIKFDFDDGDYGWSDYSEDFGEFNEVIEDVEEEVFADTQLSLEGVF